MSWWSGLHTVGVRDRLVGWKSYEKIRRMQEVLLQAGAKKAFVWMKKRQGVECPCKVEEGVIREHEVCWGTGFVGGYDRLGYREWIVYRRSYDSYYFLGDGKHYEVSYSFLGRNIVLESDWIEGGDFLPSNASSYVKEGVVEYTLDGVEWRKDLSLPVDKFKFRVIVPRDFAIARVRALEGVDSLLISESPPRRFEEWLRYGFSDVVVDIRCWTIGDLLLFTGDLVQFVEGHWKDKRYVVVDIRASQFKISAQESKILTQVMGMRKIDAGYLLRVV